VAAECDHLRELKARRRTGRGAGYAVIEAERPDASDHDVMHIDEIAYEKCNGRKAAAVAARRPLKEHADSVDETKMIRSAVYSELEWEPPDNLPDLLRRGWRSPPSGRPFLCRRPTEAYHFSRSWAVSAVTAGI
jgi:hypothetical protein